MHTDVRLPKLPPWLKPLIFHLAQLLFLEQAGFSGSPMSPPVLPSPFFAFPFGVEMPPKGSSQEGWKCRDHTPGTAPVGLWWSPAIRADPQNMN